MMVDFNEVFFNDDPNLTLLKKLQQEAIDRHDCYYCKHAQLKDRYDMGYHTGQEPWCTLYKPPEYCPLLNKDGQMCLFWEFSAPDTRKV